MLYKQSTDIMQLGVMPHPSLDPFFSSFAFAFAKWVLGHLSSNPNLISP